MKNIKKILFVIAAFIFCISLNGCNKKLFGDDSFTISFETNGGNYITPVEVKWNETLDLPEDPTRNGYNFCGWFLDSDFTKPLTDADLVIDSSFTIYSKWELASFKITFNSNGGSEVAPITDGYGKSVTVTNPTKEGYKFGGWYKDANLTEIDSLKIEDHDKEVYAKWISNKLTVKFNKGNDNAIGSMADLTIYSGEHTKLTTNQFNLEGYVFDGWVDETTGTEYENLEEINLVVVDNSTLTLTAKWKVNSYTVNFIDGNQSVKEATVDFNSTVEFPTNVTPRTGYTFNGWGRFNKVSSEKFVAGKLYYKLENNIYSLISVRYGTDIKDSNIYELVLVDQLTYKQAARNETFYASFVANSHKLFVNDGTITNELTYYTGELIDNLGTPTKVGHVFTGWFSNDQLFTLTRMGASDVNVEARFVKNQFTLIFDSNGGSDVPNATYNYLDEVTLTQLTREGFNFIGWHINELGGDETSVVSNTFTIDETLNNKATKVEDGKYILTLTAVFEEVNYDGQAFKVTFEVNGGIAISRRLVEYNSEVLPTPIRPGYEFKGWYLDSLFNTPFVKMPAEDIKVYAKWEIATITYNFYDEDGATLITKKSGDYDSSYQVPSAPNKDGKTFIGWLDTSTNITISSLSGKFGTENKDYKAVYAMHKYTTVYLNKTNGSVLYQTTLSDSTFIDLVANTYKRYKAYEFIDSAVKGTIAVQAATDEMMATILYANVYTQIRTAVLTQVLTQAGINLDIYNSLKDNCETKIQIDEAVEGYIKANINLKDAILSAVLQSQGIAVELYSSQQSVKDQIDPVVESMYYVVSNFFVDAFSYTNKTDAALMEILVDFQNKQELVAVTVNDLYLTYESAYLKYKANAYYPSLDGLVFNGWYKVTDFTTYSADGIYYVYYIAKWLGKCDTPTSLNVTNIKNDEVTLTWDECDNVWGYEVIIKTDESNLDITNSVDLSSCYDISEEDDLTNNIHRFLVKENYAIIKNISNATNIKVSVVAIAQDDLGNPIKTSSSEFISNKSLENSEETITVSSLPMILESNPSDELSYTHTIVKDVTATQSGDFYYIGESGALYLFANTIYQFADVNEYEVTSGEELVKFELEDGILSLSTKSTAGSFSFVINKNKTYNCFINPLISEVGVGTDFAEYNSAYKNGSSTKYLNQKQTPYLIGAATTNESLSYLTFGGFDPTGRYTESSELFYNGFKFDFEITSSNGQYLKTSDFDFEYKFFDSDGKEIEDTSKLFVYDSENDVFYFLKNSGIYTVKLVLKEDSASYTNMSIPKAYKDKINNYQVSFTFELNNGLNVYNHDELKKAFNSETIYLLSDALASIGISEQIYQQYSYVLTQGDAKAAIEGLHTIRSIALQTGLPAENVAAMFNQELSTLELMEEAYNNIEKINEFIKLKINLHSNIEVDTNINSFVFVGLIKDLDFTFRGIPFLVDDHGCVDIVPNTAVMTFAETNDDGFRIWTLTPNSNYSFVAKDGKTYYYDLLNGEYIISDCEFEENWDAGNFMICSQDNSIVSNYFTAPVCGNSSYLRLVDEDLLVNGNYFTVDASNLPFVRSSTGVSAFGNLPVYEIQNVTSAVFENDGDNVTSFNNLTLIGNTQDASSFLASTGGQGTDSIALYMSKTSGGVNGFKSVPRNDLANLYANLNSGSRQNYPNRDVKTSMSLENVNIYNTLIGIYFDTEAKMNLNYTHIKNSWANSSYGYMGQNITIINSLIEESGGGSIHLEEGDYILDGDPVNASLTFDLSTSTISNFVSGEEQWFKGYNMEVLALGMKSMIEQQVSAMGYSVIKKVKNEATGKMSEKMNLVFLSKNDGISNQAENNNEADLFAEIYFGRNVQGMLYVNDNGEFYIVTTVSAGTNTVYVKLPATFNPTEFGTNTGIKSGDFTIFVNQETGVYSAVQIVDIGGVNVYVLAKQSTTQDFSSNVTSYQKAFLYIRYPMGGSTLAAMVELFEK